jgi:hypothetical protein
MAGKYGSIYNAVKTALESNATLTGYVKSVYGGVRKDIPKTMMPCIIIEPRGIPEEWLTFPNKRLGKFIAEIHCILEIFDNDKQLTGGETANKGIIDFAEDVLNALDADATFGGVCEKSIAWIPEGGFIYDYFPQREVIIHFEANKRFTKGSR